ncbi:flavin reductase family protein (plasmid) [Paraburkholderia sp. D15]|uniref:flavin reductase family protein n=1 Tax=Paraburkholderia sp. D15 TaxID=2880218 RepID=UPI00247B0A98|nr:flavin reductase family protein [Paraburkholderia sp. D15]WGS55131.1 flavin reductase family protein [Paraburkholderia sp. D15]
MADTHSSEPTGSLDPKLLRATMGLFATGVTVVTFTADGQPAGMTANAFMSVSLEPPLVLVSVRASSRFNDWVREGVRYGINFLAEDQRALSGHFGGRTVENMQVPYCERDGTPLIEGSLVHIVARTVDVHPAGDHLLYIGEVEHIRFGEQRRPLIFYSGKFQQVHTHAPMISANGCIEGW